MAEVSSLTFVHARPLDGLSLRRRGKPQRLACPATLSSSPQTPPTPPTSRRAAPSPAVRRDLLSSAPLQLLPSLVSTARFVWTRMWRVMMAELAPSSPGGDYTRPLNALPRAARLAPRSTLFVGLACPWCHRALVARALALPSDDFRIEVVQVVPGRDGLWAMRPEDQEAWNATRLREVYALAAPNYVGRATAPLLVEGSRVCEDDPRVPTPEKEGVIANDSADILALIAEAGSAAPIWHQMPNDSARVAVWLRPPEGNEFQIDPSLLESFCERIYEHVNNGVYKCGFATTQAAYERAERNLFNELDGIEAILAERRFLMSPEVVTEADIRLFPTAFRLDAVYGPLFRASRKLIALDYPAIASWMRDMYALPGVRDTCDLRATHDNYYSSLFPLNPGGIVPVPRMSDLSLPRNRSGLGARTGR